MHPFSSNPEAPLFVSISRANFGNPLTRDGMLKHYQEHYRDDYFPKLLDNPAIEEKDKQIIRKLLNKPWNLYVQRHSALTDTPGILNDDNEKLVNGFLPKQCPSCNEPNKLESKFCARCKMVLTFDAYNETLLAEKELEG